METMFTVVWIFWVIALLVLYHKVFTVYYFSLGNGLFKEFMFAALIGTVMTVLSFYYWWVAAIIVVIIGLSVKGKTGSNVALVVAIIAAIFFAVVGSSFVADTDSSDSSDSSVNAVEIVQEFLV